MTDNVHSLGTDDDSTEPNRMALLKDPDPELLSKITEIHERVRSQKEERQAINKSISAAYSELESEGLDKKAVKDVIKLFDMNEDQRWNYDMSASVVRKALRIPLQGDLFVEKQIEQSAEDHQQHQQATG
ncbi:MAG: GapR family DNA-binding domain-containing protein [Candidatus Thiodiazotropha sp.]